jgi:hypothetical protein
MICQDEGLQKNDNVPLFSGSHGGLPYANLPPRRKRMGIEKTSIKVNRRLDPQSTLNPIFLHWILFKY